MSRVDEAFARAKQTPEQGPVDPVPVQGDLGADRLSEWQEEEAAAATPEPLVPELPAAAATAYVAETDPLGQPINKAERLVVSRNIDAASVEQFRRLAAQLHLSQAQHGTKMVMIASALPGEGKTLTSANLALTLSESYRLKVLLIDGDLRRPSLHDVFQVPNMTGLNDGIRAEVDRKVPVIRISEHLTILTAGRPESDPMSVLSSDRMRRVLSEAKERFDWVLIDTPPLALLSDAHLLSTLVDTTVLVVHAGKTPATVIRRVIDTIGRDRILGVVLNRVKSSAVYSEYAEYYPAEKAKATV